MEKTHHLLTFGKLLELAEVESIEKMINASDFLDLLGLFLHLSFDVKHFRLLKAGI